MSSSIEEEFQPPDWATKEEVIKAAQHYINYWKIEARSRNQQWLDALSENTRLKAEVVRLRKAGDDMAFHYQELVRIEWGPMTTHIPPSVVRWTAAKEGKPSV